MSQIDELRQWRHSAFESHLYSTAELLGDKILAMTGHPDDAYRLAEAYYAMGEFLRGAKLILNNSFETESPRCRYIAALCFMRAQELDAALDMLLKDPLSVPGSSGSANSAGSAGLSNSAAAHPTGAGASGESSRAPPHNQYPSGAVPSPPVFSTGGSANAGGHGVRVVSTSSLKTGAGMRTVSGSSRVSMILPDFEGDEASNSSIAAVASTNDQINGISAYALLQFMLGEVYTLQSKFTLAKDAYIAALKLDARCYEAFERLTKRHALTPSEEQALLRSLVFSNGGSEFARSIYALRLSTSLNQQDLEEAVDTLVETYQISPDNVDVIAARADAAYNRSQFEKARELYELILRRDPHMLRIYANYVSTLHELGEHNLLYKLVHELATDAPDEAISFYAIGIYYVGIKNIAEARRHFSKASIADPSFAPSWLAFANTFAMEAEHEQAITAYGTAARLFPRFYLPYACMGMQHFQLSNLNLAEKYLLTAADLFDGDPMILNELGVVNYHQNDLPRAHAALEAALQQAEKYELESRIVVSIKGNLGFVYRRMDRLNQALTCFEDVCRHSALDANILTAMGLCYLQQGEFDKAMQFLTRALSISRDDPIANDLIKRAVFEATSAVDVDAFLTSLVPRATARRPFVIDFSQELS